jgi:hypothetical protein
MIENKSFEAEYFGVTFFCSNILWDYALETSCELSVIMLKFEKGYRYASKGNHNIEIQYISYFVYGRPGVGFSSVLFVSRSSH